MLPLLFFFLMLTLVVGLVIAGSLAVAIWTRAVPLALAVLGGLGISTALEGGGGPAAGSTIVASLALFVVFASVFSRIRRRNTSRAIYDIDAVAVRQPARKPSAAERPVRTPTPLDVAFESLAANADWAASRVAVARESCRRFLAAADVAGWDSEAADFVTRVEKGIPDHVGKCLAVGALASPSERRAILDNCLADIEYVAAEADRHRARLLPAVQRDLDLQSRYLRHKSPGDPFALD